MSTKQTLLICYLHELVGTLFFHLALPTWGNTARCGVCFIIHIGEQGNNGIDCDKLMQSLKNFGTCLHFHATCSSAITESILLARFCLAIKWDSARIC